MGEFEESDDLETIRAVLSGHSEAFESLVRKYQKLVASVAYKMGVPRDDVEDVVSEVLVKVYTHLNRYRPEFKLSTWIYRIAANHSLDHKRRHRRDLDTVELPVTRPDEGPAASESFDRRQRAEKVRAALSELPDSYRAPLVLLHLEGCSIEEISTILSLPAGTVKTRLHRGRARLAEVLERRFPELTEPPEDA